MSNVKNYLSQFFNKTGAYQMRALPVSFAIQMKCKKTFIDRIKTDKHARRAEKSTHCVIIVVPIVFINPNRRKLSKLKSLLSIAIYSELTS